MKWNNFNNAENWKLFYASESLSGDIVKIYLYIPPGTTNGRTRVFKEATRYTLEDAQYICTLSTQSRNNEFWQLTHYKS